MKEQYIESVSHRLHEAEIGTLLQYINASVNAIWTQNWDSPSSLPWILEDMRTNCGEILTAVQHIGYIMSDHWHEVQEVDDAIDQACSQMKSLVDAMTRFKEKD